MAAASRRGGPGADYNPRRAAGRAVPPLRRRRRRAGPGRGRSGLPPAGEWGRGTGAPGEEGRAGTGRSGEPPRPSAPGLASRERGARGAPAGPTGADGWRVTLAAAVVVPGVAALPAVKGHPPASFTGWAGGAASASPSSSEPSTPVPGDRGPGTGPRRAPRPGSERCRDSPPGRTCGGCFPAQKSLKGIPSTNMGWNRLEAEDGLVRKSLWRRRLEKTGDFPRKELSGGCAVPAKPHLAARGCLLERGGAGLGSGLSNRQGLRCWQHQLFRSQSFRGSWCWSSPRRSAGSRGQPCFSRRHGASAACAGRCR